MTELPDWRLTVEVEKPSGDRSRLDPASPKADNRPAGLEFGTEDGEGFSTGVAILRRPVVDEYPDLALLNGFRFVGRDGGTAYEGRVSSIAASDEGFSLDLEGWMSHARQRQFVEVLVDRDLGRWRDMSNSRKAALISGPNFQPVTPPEVASDVEGGLPAVRLVAPVHAAGHYPTSEAWYDAGAGAQVASIYYDMVSISAAADSGMWRAADDDGGGGEISGSDLLTGTNPSSSGTHTPASAKRYAFFIFYANSAAATAEKNVTLRQLAVFGDTGLPKIVRTDGPEGIAAADAIRYLANKYAPKLGTDKVQQTSYPIPHVTWHEPINAHEAMKQLNSFHGWKLAVWENRQLEFGPYDFTVADWQVRSGQDGVRVSTQGDTTADQSNGICVNFTDFAGVSRRLTPEDSTDLTDPSDWIAANQWGDQAWGETTITWPCADDDAIQMARLELADRNRAKRPSTISVPYHLKDVHGVWHPSWAVRAGQTIAVMNQGVPVPRLITKTQWRDGVVEITTDNSINSMEAVQSRLTGLLQAAGLL